MFWICQVGFWYVACWPFSVMLCYAAITGTLLFSWTATAVFSGIWLIHNLLTSVGRFFAMSERVHLTSLKSLLFLTLQCIYYLVWRLILGQIYICQLLPSLPVWQTICVQWWLRLAGNGDLMVLLLYTVLLEKQQRCAVLSFNRVSQFFLRKDLPSW